VGRGGSDGSSAGSSVVGGSSAAVGDGGSGNSPSSSLMASFKVEGLGPQSSSEVQGVEGRGSDSHPCKRCSLFLKGLYTHTKKK
jgi:hypothetical protein